MPAAPTHSTTPAARQKRPNKEAKETYYRYPTQHHQQRHTHRIGICNLVEPAPWLSSNRQSIHSCQRLKLLSSGVLPPGAAPSRQNNQDAQRSAGAEAQAEAQRITADARAEAQRITADARKEAQRITAAAQATAQAAAPRVARCFFRLLRRRAQLKATLLPAGLQLENPRSRAEVNRMTTEY